MQSKQVDLQSITLAGLAVTTRNSIEMSGQGFIAELAQRYFTEQVAEQLQGRIQPGVTYALYTDFEDEDRGCYTYLIGEQVDANALQSHQQVAVRTVPASSYQCFTTPEGQMPSVVLTAWQRIWSMSGADFLGRRRFIADFELYDQRSIDPQKTVLDIYIGVE